MHFLGDKRKARMWTEKREGLGMGLNSMPIHVPMGQKFLNSGIDCLKVDFKKESKIPLFLNSVISFFVSSDCLWKFLEVSLGLYNIIPFPNCSKPQVTYWPKSS